MNIEIEKSTAQGRVKAPSSKSMAHRLLICAGLAKGESILHDISLSEDIKATLGCLKSLGADYTYSNGTIRITEICPDKLDSFELDCMESGSTLRFFIPLCLLTGKETVFRGTKKLLSRPLDVYQTLCEEQDILYGHMEDMLIVRGKLSSGEFVVRGDISSQFISGLLFALPLLEGDSRIKILPPVESRSYIDLTVKALADFGIDVVWQTENSLFIKGGQMYQSREATVEGDYSNAAFLEVFNYLGGDVTVDGLDENSLQGDKVYRKMFRELDEGCPVLDLSNCPDLGPILFTLAAVKNGAVFTGTKRLKIKESDRTEVMAEELAKFGANVQVAEDSVTICHTELHAPEQPLYGHNDHRVVMSLAVLSTLYSGKIEGAEAVKKSFPDFFEKLFALNIKRKAHILIVGLGLIGGSYARALTKQGYRVTAITKEQSSIDFALKEGIIENGTTIVTEDAVKDADIVIFALYPHVFMKWIQDYQHFIKSGAVLTDVTGVKGTVVSEIQEILRSDLEFIGAHPMAGREVSGVENSDDSIFEGANYIVTPTEKNTEEAVECCKELGRILGFENISVLSLEEHDEMIGFLSQLTHCIAVSLMTCKDCEHLAEYTGDSFRDLTRIAKINDEMWSELFLLNKEELLSQMNLFIHEFEKMRNMLEKDDVNGMREMMRKSTERRRLFDKKED